MTAEFNADTHMRLPSGKVVPLADPAYTKRTDLWVDAFDGTYRLFLPLAQLVELERKSGYIDKDGNQRAGSVFQVYDRVSKGRYELDGKAVGFASEGAATLNDCRETVRLALIGGGHAVVAGERVKISSRRALELVETYLSDAPLEEAWTLAFLILNAAICGREQEPHEVGHHSRTPVFPLSAEDSYPEALATEDSDADEAADG